MPFADDTLPYNPLSEINQEEIIVRDWRWISLWNAGYDSRLCDLFASRNDLDLHKLVDAKTNGCSDAQALKIFA